MTLCDPWAVAHETPLSGEFSREEHWSSLPFSSPRSGIPISRRSKQTFLQRHTDGQQTNEKMFAFSHYYSKEDIQMANRPHEKTLNITNKRKCKSKPPRGIASHQSEWLLLKSAANKCRRRVWKNGTSHTVDGNVS